MLSSRILIISLMYHLLGIYSISAVPTPQNDKAPKETNVYLVRTKRYEDQHSTSSGYAYETKGPTSYVQFKSYGPVQTVKEVKLEQQVSLPVELPMPLSPITKHISKKEIDQMDKEAYYDDDDDDDTLSHIESTDNDDEDDEEEADKDNYEVAGGSRYEDAENSKHGEKGSSGYANNEHFAKGGKGHHSKENAKESHAESGGHKKADHENEGHYADGHASAHAEKGGSHSESESHKKGSKTTGFHKVYRKDEYKKDHVFYDEKNVKGHHDSYGSGHKNHESKEGGFRNGGHHESKHHEGEFAKAGKFDKGRYDDYDAGFKEKQGGEKYHQHHQDYKGADGKHSYQKEAY